MMSLGLSDLGGLTLRELVWMSQGRQRFAWSHTASLMSLLANLHRDPKRGRATRPSDFIPQIGPKKRPPPLDIESLRVFVKPDAEQTPQPTAPTTAQESTGNQP